MNPQKIKQASVWVGTVLAWSALGLFVILIGIALFARHEEPSPQLTASAGSAASSTTEATLIELEKSFKCPNDYASPEEYLNAAAKFVHDFNQIIPNSASADLLEYRQQLLESHQCEPSKWL